MLNDFTKIVAGAVTVLLAGGLALGTTQHQPATASHQQPATASNLGSASHATLDSFFSQPLIGSSVASSATLAQETSQFGTLPIVRVYYPGLPAADAWSTGLAEANKSAVIVSFNADPTAIISGSDNAALAQFFDAAPTGHAIYYSYYHEPEVPIATGQFTAAAYRQAWGVIVGIADQAHNPDLHSTLILMAYDLQSSSGRNWLVAASKSAGLPFGFSEFGTSVVSGRSSWLTSVGNYLASSGALFGTLFDAAGPQPSMALTDSASISAWNNVVASSDHANGISDS
jgi:hypothetical protein